MPTTAPHVVDNDDAKTSRLCFQPKGNANKDQLAGEARRIIKLDPAFAVLLRSLGPRDSLKDVIHRHKRAVAALGPQVLKEHARLRVQRL